ncbi:hypothetical protein AAVH_19264 [Aphelenchoides avenae]|nr:hypothetical protein AAVH_19264 [Aphelenchus avenae]
MTVHISPLAKYHIADFVNYREQLFGPDDGARRHRIPLPEYAASKEFDICLRNDVSPNAVEYLFAEGPQATFWHNVPPGLISTIVKPGTEHGFAGTLQQPSQTSLRPIFCVIDDGTPGPTLLWHELYVDYFPCVRCQRKQLGGEEQLPGRERPNSFADPKWPGFVRYTNTAGCSPSRHLTTYIIEVFHIKRTVTGEGMTIELWFNSLCRGIVDWGGLFPANSRVQMGELCLVKIYAGDCANPAPTPPPKAGPHRRRLLAELMLEAYRFLDRYSLDVGQLVCGEWRGTIERSSEQLALYELSAEFKHVDCKREQERTGDPFRFLYSVRSPVPDHEWTARFVNNSDCVGDVNARTFYFLKDQPPAHSSAVIRRHLRNAFVKRMSCDVGARDFEWTAGMLLGLSDSTLVDGLNALFMCEECLALFGRFEEGLIRRKVQKLDLTVLDPLLKALVDRHDFFGRPSIRQLKEIDLRTVHQHLNAPLEPYWLPAVYELSECRHFGVDYRPEPVQQPVENLVDVSRDFEGSGRDIAVDRFSLTCFVDFPSLVGNRKPAGEMRVPYASYLCWNVYYYETADKKKCLTLLVPKVDDPRVRNRDIHVMRGKFTAFIEP